MSNNEDERERRRRLSSIQRTFGGAIKRRVVNEPPQGQGPGPSGFQFPKLRRAPRRPSYEQQQSNLEYIPEETEEAPEETPGHSSDLSDYRDAEEETTEQPSSSSVPEEEPQRGSQSSSRRQSLTSRRTSVQSKGNPFSPKEKSPPELSKHSTSRKQSESSQDEQFVTESEQRASLKSNQTKSPSSKSLSPNAEKSSGSRRSSLEPPTDFEPVQSRKQSGFRQSMENESDQRLSVTSNQPKSPSLKYSTPGSQRRLSTDFPVDQSRKPSVSSQFDQSSERYEPMDNESDRRLSGTSNQPKSPSLKYSTPDSHRRLSTDFPVEQSRKPSASSQFEQSSERYEPADNESDRRLSGTSNQPKSPSLKYSTPDSHRRLSTDFPVEQSRKPSASSQFEQSSERYEPADNESDRRLSGTSSQPKSPLKYSTPDSQRRLSTDFPVEQSRKQSTSSQFEQSRERYEPFDNESNQSKDHSSESSKYSTPESRRLSHTVSPEKSKSPSFKSLSSGADKSSKHSTPDSRRLSFKLSPNFSTKYSFQNERSSDEWKEEENVKISSRRMSSKPPSRRPSSRSTDTRNRESLNSDVEALTGEHFDSPLPPPPPPSPASRNTDIPKKRFSLPFGTKKNSNPTPSSKRSKSQKSRYSILEEEEEEDDEEEELDTSSNKRLSINFTVLEDREKVFHELVAAGDVETVKKFLHQNRYFNINCVNFQKTSALHISMRDLNEAMVIFLLSLDDINACDAVLIAVKIADLPMLTTVLNCLEKTHPGLEFSPCVTSAEFPDDLTPLMLAAQEGRFEIVDILLNRGHRMPDIHKPSCTCVKCKENVRKYDYLKYSTIKINQYKAIASPMYFFQTTSDPIRRAFELTNELQAAARMYPQFYKEYEELWKGLRVFSAEFIGCCRNSEEVELVLNQPAGCDAAGALLYPRLQFAVDCTQKEFVAHPFVQAVLESAWVGDEKDWKMKPVIDQALAPLFRIPMLFFIFVLSYFLPTNQKLKKYQAPINKFISSFAGYFIFLAVICTVSAEEKINQKRGQLSLLKGVVFLYDLGYFWGICKMCAKLGPKRFFSIGWIWFDCAMVQAFMLTCFFWFVAWVDVKAYNDENLPRKFWNPYDPTLIAEGLFAIATIFAFLRFYLPMSLNYYYGPLQVSIGKMLLDISKFVQIFGLLMISWAAGLYHLYRPYSGMINTDHATGTKTTQVDSFVNFTMTLKTLFWTLFGMTSIEVADVIITNSGENDGSAENHHSFTQGIGYLCFAAYNFIGVIVVLNMLVACMANTHTKVIDNIPVEWVFGRTKIYILYMYHSVLPSPFNLIPKPADLVNAVAVLKVALRKGVKCSFAHCCFMERDSDNFSESDFQKLMSELAQRYICMKNLEKDN